MSHGMAYSNYMLCLPFGVEVAVPSLVLIIAESSKVNCLLMAAHSSAVWSTPSATVYPVTSHPITTSERIEPIK